MLWWVYYGARGYSGCAGLLVVVCRWNLKVSLQTANFAYGQPECCVCGATLTRWCLQIPFPTFLSRVRATAATVYNTLNENEMGRAQLRMELRYYTLEHVVPTAWDHALLMTGERDDATSPPRPPSPSPPSPPSPHLPHLHGTTSRRFVSFLCFPLADRLARPMAASHGHCDTLDALRKLQSGLRSKVVNAARALHADNAGVHLSYLMPARCVEHALGTTLTTLWALLPLPHSRISV